MKTKKQKLLVVAGGTGGHIIPALAIAEEWRRRRPQDEIVFVGTRRGIEQKLVPTAGFRLQTIIMSGLARGWSWREIANNLMLPFRLIIGFIQSLWILIRFRPSVIIGCGGYVTGPVVWLGAMINRLTFIQEQNSRPGRTTIFLSRWVCRTFLAYEEARQWIAHSDQSVIYGNPLRLTGEPLSQQEARAVLGVSPDKTTLLIVGGSQGARSINQAMMHIVSVLMNELGIQIIWQTGQADYADLRERINNLPGVYLYPFIERMHEAYSAADLILCRAGAMTLSEIASYGLPAVLVPYPYAADNHQEYNAQAIVRAGAGVMIRHSELDQQLLLVLKELLNETTRRQEMAEAMRRLARPEAAAQIVNDMIGWLEQCRKC